MARDRLIIIGAGIRIRRNSTLLNIILNQLRFFPGMPEIKCSEVNPDI